MNVKMPGGTLQIEIDEAWNIKMTGEVREIASGTFSNELIAELE
jgi:diaminopimelate epimerase